MKSFSQKWELDSLFSFGNHPAALAAYADQLKHQILQFEKKFHQLSDVKKGILFFQELDGHCRDLQYFIECLLSQNTSDQEALQLLSQVSLLRAECDSLGEGMNSFLAELDEATFNLLISDPDLEPIEFHLNERRQMARNRMPVELERLAHQLAIDGYQGWNEIYETFLGQLRIPSPLSPEETLSVGQAANRFSHPDRAVRKAWFQRWEETWKTHEQLAAQMLNHLAGFRLNLYKMRGWRSILEEPLFGNRMQERTLRTMWGVVENHSETLQTYLNTKARLLNIPQLAWYDLEAPLPFSIQTNISFDDAASLIIRYFNEFSPEMGEFARHAFENRWIEAEDRPGKRPGGFCAPFCAAKQSRIFMTYSNTMTNVLTLAHELGHAYHSHAVRNLPVFAQEYRMNVAETASTLAEMVVLDKWLEETKDPQVRLSLLDTKLQRAVMFLMNIQARFLFEVNFYQERRKGFILPSELNAFMETAQRRAFGNALSEWHPHFWVAKQHFFITEIPFYNFPYTFGYLFSQGVYAHLKELSTREKKYASLLRDTGRLTVEELAYDHLGVRLEEPLFWENAMSLIENDIVEFSNLYDKLLIKGTI